MINVLITAIGGGGHGDQILKALRLAEPGRYNIYGADANPHCAQKALVKEFVTLPLASDAGYLKTLLEVCRTFSIQALFHGCEPELKLFAKQRAMIESEGIFLPINATEVIELCMDKVALNKSLFSLGFNSPRYTITRDLEWFSSIDCYPVVIKPAVGSGGSAHVYIAQNSRELLALADYLGLGTLTHSFIIQEYVGKPEDEFTVGILHDLNGRFIDSIAVNRDLSGGLNVRISVPNRTCRTDLGDRLVISSGISQGRIGKYPNVIAQCREIAEALGSRGPMNIQCRLVNGKVFVFEINPRFSGTTSLRAMVGFNEPDLLLRRHMLQELIETDREWPYITIVRTLVENLVPEKV